MPTQLVYLLGWVLVDRDCSVKTKISQLQDALLGDKDVLSLYVSGYDKNGQIESGTMDDEIPVGDLVVVDEEEALAHLLQDLLDLAEAELHIDVAEQASQVMLAEV